MSQAGSLNTGGGGGAFTSINVQTFIMSGTYTPTANMKFAIVEVQAGGGGGSGGNSGNFFTGGGGGGYAKKVLASGAIGASQTVTVGAGGAGGAGTGAAGGNGGSSSFGAIVSATGGTGGDFPPSGAASPGGIGSGGDLNLSGGWGVKGNVGGGGNSFYGVGGYPVQNYIFQSFPGIDGLSYGSGGSGALFITDPAAGGNGASGIVIVTEYIGV